MRAIAVVLAFGVIIATTAAIVGILCSLIFAFLINFVFQRFPYLINLIRSFRGKRLFLPRFHILHLQ